MQITGAGLVQLRNPLSSSLLNMTMKLAVNNKNGLPDSLVLLKSLVGENLPIEIEVEHQNVDGRFTEYSEVPAVRVFLDHGSHRFERDPARLRHPCRLNVRIGPD